MDTTRKHSDWSPPSPQVNCYLQVLSLRWEIHCCKRSVTLKQITKQVQVKPNNKIKEVDFYTTKKMTLDNSINNVKTTAVIFDNHIQFFFDVPILDKESSFNLFSLIPATAFVNNITFNIIFCLFLIHSHNIGIGTVLGYFKLNLFSNFCLIVLIVICHQIVYYLYKWWQNDWIICEVIF